MTRSDRDVFTLACGDVMPGCPTRFAGHDEQEVLGQVAEHAAEVHGITTVPPEVLTQVQDKIVGPGPS